MTADKKRWQPATKAAQALGLIDPETKALVPPLHMATTFLRDADNLYRAGYAYRRDQNPTYDAAERVIAELEEGAEALLFASGNAAAVSLFQALQPGDHVVVPKVMYWGLRKWLLQIGQRWGLQVSLCAMEQPGALQAALRPGQTKLVWIETPANPLWGVTDIAEAAALAHDCGAVLAVDSTVATPVFTRPLTLGADYVMHSATKYLNGHSDVLAGALVGRETDKLWPKIRQIRHDGGAVLGSMDAWLLARGMRTLFVRVTQAARNAHMIAEHFSGHPAISTVLYPGLQGHPGHAVAVQQMQGGYGAMLSLRFNGGEEAAIATAAAVQLWKRATSLGGVESLIEHRASIEGEDTPVPADLLRLSVGLEDPHDLISDLENAMMQAQAQ